MDTRSQTADGILAEDSVVVMPLESDEPTETAAAVNWKPKKDHKHRFWICLLIYFLVLMIAASAGLIWLNNSLIDYENATPNGALNNYVDRLKSGNFEAIYQDSALQETTFNNKEQILLYLSNTYNGNPNDIRLRERVSTDADKKEYAVYYDDTRKGIITVTKTDGRWQITPNLVYLPPVTLIAESDARITVNGQDITFLDIPKEEVQSLVYTGINQTDILPTLYSYTFEGLLNPPIIEGVDLNGNAYTATASNDGAQYALTKVVADKQAEYETLAIDAATTYAKYIAKDATRNTLLTFVHKKSTLYQTIRNFSNSWFSTHESYEFLDLKVSEFKQYTDRDFSCDVSFQPTYVRKGKTFKGEPVHYQVAFIQTGDTFLMYALNSVVNTAPPETSTSPSSTTITTTTTTTA